MNSLEQEVEKIIEELKEQDSCQSELVFDKLSERFDSAELGEAIIIAAKKMNCGNCNDN